MSVRQWISILFAVVSTTFIAISKSSSLVNDQKIGQETNFLKQEKNMFLEHVPVRSGFKSFDWQPVQTHQLTSKTKSEVKKKIAVSRLTKQLPKDQLSDMWSDVRARTGRKLRGFKEGPNRNALPDKEVPVFVGNSKTSCLLPEDGLTTAEILCKLTPTFKTCKSYCVYGYTYEEGIVRTSHCNYLENRWSQEFDECKPFIDCNLKMIAPGSLKCVGNHVDKPPTCEIKCLVYEENDPIPKQNFTCNTDGSWDPYLPHCVEPRGNKILAYPPMIPEHDDILYP